MDTEHFFLKPRVLYSTKECSSTGHPCIREFKLHPDPFNPEYNNRMLLSSPSSTPTPLVATEGRRHGTWPQCVSLCVKIATSNPVILMFDSHRWVLRRLSSSKGYDVKPWLLIHRKRKHWDARGMNLSLSRMPIKLNQPPWRWYTHEWHECVTTVECH